MKTQTIFFFINSTPKFMSIFIAKNLTLYIRYGQKLKSKVEIYYLHLNNSNEALHIVLDILFPESKYIFFF